MCIRSMHEKELQNFFLKFHTFSLLNSHTREGEKYMGPYLVNSLMTSVMNCC